MKPTNPLQEADENFRLLVIGVQDYAIMMLDLNGYVTSWNPAAERILGYQTDEIIGQSFTRFYTVEAIAGGLAEYELKMTVTHGRFEDEGWRVRKNGSQFWANVIITALYDDVGQLRGFAKVTRDITSQKRAEEALRASEERFRLLADATPNGLLMVNKDGQIALANKRAETLFGYAPGKLVGQLIENLVPERFRSRHPNFREGFVENPHARPMGAGRDLFALRQNGTEFPVEIGLNPIETSEGQFTLASIIDITERKRLEARFRATIESAPTAMVMIDQTGAIVLVNSETEKLFGYTRETLLTQSVELLLPERLRSHHPNFRKDFFSTPQSRRMGAGRDLFGLRQDGTEFPVEIGLNPVETEEGLFVLSAIVDITERKRAEAQITDALREKEVLLKEIHHRVKNNLQVISSLLRLQAESLTDPNAHELFMDSQRRVRSMALIHEQLYQSHDLAHINLGDYATSLVNYLRRSYVQPISNIQVRVEIAPINMEIDRAMPLGLIINELVSNALKHAFTSASTPHELWITLVHEPLNHLTLVVGDNGIGLPDDLNLEEPLSMGWQLVQSFVMQLHGRLIIQRSPGTKISIIFPDERKENHD